MRYNSYENAIAYLRSLTDYETFKTVSYDCYREQLAVLRDFLSFIGNPQERIKTVHVAGTKGKGSVCHLLEESARHAGYRTGLFTSPHLYSLGERFRVNGLNCSDELFASTFWHVKEKWDQFSGGGKYDQLTFFEWSVLIAFELFLTENVELAILETGLGGRFDATNLSQPIVTAITGISYDHCELLGNSLLEIAREKAGIIKPGVPVICGVGSSQLFRTPGGRHDITPDDVAELRRFFAQEAARMNAPLIQIDSISDDVATLPMALRGIHQKWNASIVTAIMEQLNRKGFDIPRESYLSAIANTIIPGRIELLQSSPPILFDTAHNRASAAVLAQTLNHDYPDYRKALLFGASFGKDIEGIFYELVPCFDKIIFTNVADHSRSMSPESLQEKLAEFLQSNRSIRGDKEPLEYEIAPPATPWQSIAGENLGANRSLFCISGSFYLAPRSR